MDLHFTKVTTDFATISSVAPEQVKSLKDLPHFFVNTVCQITAKPLRAVCRLDSFDETVLQGDRRLVFTLLATALKDSIEAAALVQGKRVSIADPTPEEAKEIAGQAQAMRHSFLRNDSQKFTALINVLEDVQRNLTVHSNNSAYIQSDDDDVAIMLPVTPGVRFMLNKTGRSYNTTKPLAKTKLLGDEFYVSINCVGHQLHDTLYTDGFMANLDHEEMQRELVLALGLAFPWMLANDHLTNAVLDFRFDTKDADLPAYFSELRRLASKRVQRLSAEDVAVYVQRSNFMANPTES